MTEMEVLLKRLGSRLEQNSMSLKGGSLKSVSWRNQENKQGREGKGGSLWAPSSGQMWASWASGQRRH